jgi:hypothetical protein
MTQTPGDPSIPEINRDPARIHGAEQMWAQAQQHLDKIIANVRQDEPRIIAQTGGNTDDSALYDFLKGYIMQAERISGQKAHDVTILMCAAAIVRLVRAPRTDDILAQLDWETGDNNDDQH